MENRNKLPLNGTFQVPADDVMDFFFVFPGEAEEGARRDVAPRYRAAALTHAV